MWNKHITFTKIRIKGKSRVIIGDSSRSSQKYGLFACLDLIAFNIENAAPGSNRNSIVRSPQNVSDSKQENLEHKRERNDGFIAKIKCMD